MGGSGMSTHTAPTPVGTVDDLSGHRIVVVGGASGIGAGVVAALLGSGAAVSVLDRQPATESVDAADGPFTSHVVDVRDEASLKAAVGSAVEDLGGVDGLVYAAGVLDGYATLEELSEELLDVVFDVNTHGAVRTLKHVVPHMRDAGYGRIVMFGSIAGIVGGAAGLAYTMSKHAMTGLVKHLALELGPAGVTINEVAPGSVQGTAIRTNITEIIRDGSVATNRGLGVQSPDEAKLTYPVGRLGTVDAVVPTVLHLLRPSSWFVTGTTVT